MTVHHLLHRHDLHPDLPPAAAPWTLPDAEAVYARDLAWVPGHLTLSLRLDLARERIEGRALWTLRASRDGRHPLTLDAVGLQDLAVAGEGEPRATADGRTLTLTWAAPAAAGEHRSVEITWWVERPRAGFYFGGPSAWLPDHGPFACTDHETERARHWLPCVDAPQVRTTLDLHIRTDAAWQVVANGALEGVEDHTDGTRTHRWVLRQPCPSYLLCIAAGDLVRVEDETVDGIPVRYWTTPPHGEQDLRRNFGRTPAMLRWLQQRLDVPYPFATYDQVAVEGIGGAMENISLVAWDDRFLLPADVHAEWGHLVDQINVHEMAHMWFGDWVVCRDYAHTWLKESWATYIEQVWYEECHGPDLADWENWLALQTYFGETERYRRPLMTRHFHSSWQLYDAHLYPGGACRLHMLRQWLGEDAFWAGTRRYLERCGGGVAETDDFRRAMEEASGRSLAPFFDQWFCRPGHPKVKVAFEYDAERGLGTWTFTQTQADAALGIGFFEVPTDVAWEADGVMHRTPVLLRGERTVHSERMPGPPTMVRVNAVRRAVMEVDFAPGEACLGAQLERAPDVQGRILASQGLCRLATPSALGTVIHALAREPFAGVRLEQVRALAGTFDARAWRAVVEHLRREDDPTILADMIRAAGKVRLPALAEALHDRLKAGLRPRAAAAAWAVLAQLQRDDAVPALLDALDQAPPAAAWVQEGVVAALADTLDEAALPALLEALTPGRIHGRARRLVPGHLVRLAGVLPNRRDRRKVVDALLAGLADPDGHLARRCTMALAGWAEGQDQAGGALDAVRARMARQEQVSLDIARAGAASGASAAGQARDLDTLRRQVVTLREQLQALEARSAAAGPEKI